MARRETRESQQGFSSEPKADDGAAETAGFAATADDAAAMTVGFAADGTPIPRRRIIPDEKSEDKETDHLLRILSIQAVTRREARTACRGKPQRAERASSEGAKEAEQSSTAEFEETHQDLISLIRKYQPSDPNIARILKDLEGQKQKGFHIKNGLLFKDRQVVVPQQRALIEELLQVYHDDPLAGHWGREKTLDLLRRTFYWKGMSIDVAEYVATCPTQEVDSILVIVDRYTKMVRCFATSSDATAADFAELFHQKIKLKHGSPRGIVSDRDSKITSKFWARVCHKALIKRRLSTAFHPQTDGQTEILNRILEHYLRAFASNEQASWAKLLPAAEFAYNNSRNSTTGISPFRALYGYDPELRFDIADDVPEGEIPAARDRIRRLHELRQELRKKLNSSKKLQILWVGPFRITERIGHSAYRLALPDIYAKLYDVFLIQSLEPYHVRDGHEETTLPMPPLEDEPDEWEVEEVVGKSQIQGNIHYLVKWAGWPSEYNQWVPETDMVNAQDTIRKFGRTKKGRKAEEALTGRQPKRR
ncbi:hypothetical protein MKZ38_009887 [Zalerion maritima]|uniref:Uncharacterized protein n=1 Tax=Zalerion maritima TaxID=339359 RepID=A0AAD5WVH8_9PEZI|nr:hypothetical protein MKZ38_009887 [Zalerion maritima]